jgi:hypothetical protein
MHAAASRYICIRPFSNGENLGLPFFLFLCQDEEHQKLNMCQEQQAQRIFDRIGTEYFIIKNVYLQRVRTQFHRTEKIVNQVRTIAKTIVFALTM